MPETVEERARRLGLIGGPPETVEARAHRLGLDDSPLSAARASAKRFATEGTTAHEIGLPDESTADRASGAVSAAYKGLTLGQGNKIIAAMRSGLNTPGVPNFIGNRIPISYDAALKEQENVLGDYSHRRPEAAAILETAGSLPTLAARLPLAGISVMRGALNAAKATPAIAEHLPVIGRGIRLAKAIERIGQRLAPETEAAGGDVIGAIKPKPSIEPIEGLMGNEPPLSAPSAVLDVVKQAPRQSHRTAASFEDFAQRMGQRPPASSLDKQLHDLITKARAENPSEVGATWGDAEEAMGLAPHQQPNLEEQLQQSLQLAKKAPNTIGTPRGPR